MIGLREQIAQDCADILALCAALSEYPYTAPSPYEAWKRMGGQRAMPAAFLAWHAREYGKPASCEALRGDS